MSKMQTDAATVHVKQSVYELTTSIDSIMHDTVLSFFCIKFCKDGRIIGKKFFH